MTTPQQAHTPERCPVCDETGFVAKQCDACPLCARRAEAAWRAVKIEDEVMQRRLSERREAA